MYKNIEKQDVLNRQNQIADVKSIIEQSRVYNKGLSLAINGGWGCGKTFFLKQLIKEYENDSFVFYYDAWSNNYYEEPLIGLLDCIRQKLNEVNKKNGVLRAVAQDALKIIVHFFDCALESKIGFKPIKTIGNVKKYIEKKKEESDLGDSFNPYSDLSNAKATIIKALDELSSKGNRVVILIDELDRCDPRYSMKALERIHHISSSTNSTILVAVDKNQLENLIKSIYSYGDSETASHYLRKIVDYTYDLGNGSFNSEKHDVIFGELEKLFSNCVEPYITHQDVVLFEYLLFQSLDIRRIEKLVNYTILNHKVVFKNEKCTPLLMCGELLLGWALLRFHNKNEILTELSKDYKNNLEHCSIYGYIRDELRNCYLTAAKTADGRPHIEVCNLPTYLFYLINSASRTTITVRYNISRAVSQNQNRLLLEEYLNLITETNV